jgi:hypothetical protein
MHQGFATRQYHPSYLPLLHGRDVVGKILARQLLTMSVGFPDVAHHTATIAAAVWHQDNDR